MKKKFLLLLLLTISMNCVISQSGKLPKQLLPLDSIRRHTKLKELFGSPGWKLLSTNSISSGILIIKDRKCFVKWHDEVLPIAFSCEEMGKPEELIFKAKEVSKLKNSFQLVFEYTNVTLKVLLSPKKNVLEIMTLATSKKELAVRIGWQVDIPDKQIFWHDNIYQKRQTIISEDYNTLANSGVGKWGKQSIYPLAVISSSDDILAGFVDVSEPVFYCLNFYKNSNSKFQFYFDTVLSKKTPRAKLCSSQSGGIVVLEGKQPFRNALKKYYVMYPKCFESPSPSYAGNWLPFTDSTTIPDIADFGFSADECHNADLKFNANHNIGTFYYTEPWLTWIKMPENIPRTPAATIKLLKTKDKKLFPSVFLNGQRNKNNEIAFQFHDTPWCDGARIPVYPNPGFPGNKTHAQYVWTSIRADLEQENVAGLYLDSMNANTALNYDTNQLAYSDFPAIFAHGDTIPALHGSVSLFEFCEPLADVLHKNNQQVMGNFPVDAFSFVPQFVDVPGQETMWFSNGEYYPMPEEKMFHCRTMSGKKPYLFLQCCDFNKLGPHVEKYFARCAAFGFFPSMFSHDSSSDPYWEDPKLYNRDRHLFKKYIPIIKSLANAGWEPVPVARTDSDVWLEQFGSPEKEWWLTLYNPSKNIVSGWLELDDKTNKWTGYLPLTDSYIIQNADSKSPFAIAPEQVIIIKMDKESFVLPKKIIDTLKPSIMCFSASTAELVSTQIVVNGVTKKLVDFAVYPPLELFLSKANVIAVGKTALLFFKIKNRCKIPRDISVSYAGTSSKYVVPGETGTQLIFRISGKSGETLSGDFIVESKKWRVNKEVRVRFLDASANKLCDDSVKISVDSSFPGYSVSTLADGIKATAGLHWAKAAWASGEHGQQHWILCEFAKPEIISTVAVHWAVSGGEKFVSREIELWHEETIGKWIRLAITNPSPAESSTSFIFSPQRIRKLKLRQPPNKGSISRPQLFWLRELEIF